MSQTQTPLLQKDFQRAYHECLSLRDLLVKNAGVELTPYQLGLTALIFHEVLSGGPREISFQWARQTGKTEALVHATITLSTYFIRWLQRYYNVAFIAPAREEQSIVVTRERLQKYVSRLKPWLKPVLGIDILLGEGRRTADYIFRSSSGYEAPIRCVSANPKAFVKGKTEDLMIFEQIEEMDPEKMINDIFPFGAGSEWGCTRILAGSAAPVIRNWYYYQTIEPFFSTDSGPPRFVDDRLAEIYRPGYGRYVADMRRRIGEDSDAYLTQFRNVWVLPRNKLIDRPTLMELQYPPGMVFSPNNLRCAGMDIGKRSDRTVLTAAERQGFQSYILPGGWLEFKGTDYELQADEAAPFCRNLGIDVLEIDITGPGDPVGDMMKRRLAGICTVVGIRLTQQENDRIYKQYEMELLGKRIHYPPDQTPFKQRFVDEHLDVERVYNNNMLKLEAPSRAGAHDDYVISSALMVDALLGPSFSDLPVLTRSR